MSSITEGVPPRTYKELKPWLKEHYNSLPRRLQNLATYALENPDVIALNTIAVISEKAKVTDSTFVRFAKSLGYEGFSDMQSVFQDSMHHIPEPYSKRLNKLDIDTNSEGSVLHQFCHAASFSLVQLEQQIEEKVIVNASEILANARTIYIAGSGRATPVTTYLHYNLVKMGVQAVILDETSTVINDKAQLIRDDEALLAVSFNPYTANTKDVVDICLENKVPVVALTDSILSPISRSDDLHIEILEQEVGGIKSLSATMCLALCLAVETGKRFPTKKFS